MDALSGIVLSLLCILLFNNVERINSVTRLLYVYVLSGLSALCIAHCVARKSYNNLSLGSKILRRACVDFRFVFTLNLS